MNAFPHVLPPWGKVESGRVLRIAVLAGLSAMLVHLAYWLLVGPTETIGADRAHMFLVQCRYPSLLDAFANVSVDRYRPLSVWGEGALTCLRIQPGLLGPTLVVLQMSVQTGIAIGLLVAIGLLSTESLSAALCGAFLLLFSNALLASNFVVLFSMFEVEPLICLLTCALGQLLRMREHRRLGTLLIIVSGLIGPWLREVGVVGPAAILVVELLALPRRRSFFFLLPAALVVHALMPVMLPALLSGQPERVRWMFAGNEVGSNFQTALVNWWRTGRILNEVPGILWFLVVLAGAMTAGRLVSLRPRLADLHSALCGRGLAPSGQRPDLRVAAAFAAFSLACLSLMFIELDTPEASAMKDLRVEWLPIAWMLGFLTLSAFRFGALLPVLTVVLYLPLLRQPSNYESHLPFLTAPLCLLVGAWLVELKFLDILKRSLFLRSALATLLAVAFAAQAQNFLMCYLTNRALMKLTGDIGGWLSANLAPRSVVYTNSFPAFEIYDRGGRSVDMKWIVPAGPITHVASFRPILTPENQAAYALQAKAEGRSSYYLLNLSAQREANYAHPPANTLEKIQTWQLVLPSGSLDPLRASLFKPFYMQVFAPFQWRSAVEHYDPRQNRTGTVVEYALFKWSPSANAPTMAPPVPLVGRPVLVVDGYNDTNYNIIEAGGRFYGLARSEGPFELAMVEAGAYRQKVYVGGSLTEVQSQLNARKATPPSPRPEVAQVQVQPPKLIADGFRNSQFNIVSYGGRFYGIARANGPFDPGKVERREYPHPVYAADSLEEIETWIVTESNLR